MKNKKRLFVLFLLILIPVSYANFTVDFTPVKDKFNLGEEGIINISITNLLNTIEEFRIPNIHFPAWDMYTMPIQNPLIVKVYPQKTSITTLYLKPSHLTVEGSYNVDIFVENKKTKEKKSISVPLVVRSKEEAGYIPTVILNVDIPKEIDPRMAIPIRVKLENKNILDLNATLYVDSNIFYKEHNLRLGPLETKNIELIQEFDPLIQPQKDNVAITLKRKNETIASVTKRVEILAYSEIKRDIIEKKEFLKTKKEVIFKNQGNKIYEGSVNIKTTLLKVLFTTTEPKANLVKDKNRLFSWTVNLEPNQEFKVTVIENYRMLMIALVIIVVIVILYFIYRTPLIINKSFANLITKEGGISNLKVVLTIKNRGTKGIDNIEIVDKIPHLIEVVRDISIGTISPKQVLKHEKHGTFLKWHIDKLDAGEERVINYKIMTGLSIIGDLNLPAAIGRFVQNNKKRLSHSNTLTISPPS